MQYIALFFVTLLTALAAENAIFGRALGLSRPLLFLKSPRMGILYGTLLTWVGTVSSIFVAGINFFLEGNPYIPFVRAPLYFLSVALVYFATYFGTQKYRPGLFAIIHGAFPLSVFNSALFGALYVSSSQNYGFLQTVSYALGSGIGYTLALLIIYYARKRLAISPVPRSFRGLPILLVYIGLLSLAIYGLIGHGLVV